MRNVLHILFYKILIFLKVNSPFNFSVIVRGIGSGLVYSIFAYGCYLLSQNTIEYLLLQVKIGNFLLHRFILVVLFIFFIAINVGNMVVSFSTLYKSNEVAHLITKPISFIKIFLIKFLDNFFYSSTTLLLIITAVLIGYGNYFNFSFWMYPFILLFLVLPFMFTAGTAGVIVLLVILRLAGKWGIKKVLSVLGTVYAIGIITFYFVSNPLNLVQKVFDYYPNINQYFGFLESGLVNFLPNYWIAESLYWLSENRFDRAFPYIYVNILTSIVVFLFSLYLAKKWFYQTWLTSLKINAELKSSNSRKNLFFGFDKESIFKEFNEAVIKREFWLFFREPNQWVHFLVMIFLIIIFVSSISGIDIIILRAYNQYLKTVVYLVISLFNVFLVASLSLRFVFPLISLEGEALWKIRSAPINYNQLLSKRLIIHFVIIFIVGQIITFFSNYQFPAQLGLIAQFNAAITTITLVSLNFGMGGLFANYKEKNAIRLASSQGASITFLFTILYLVILIIILFIPVYNYFYSVEKGMEYSFSSLILSSLVLLLIALIVSSTSLKLGFRSFHSDV
jgi:ABC-2 type transport system permease protein